MFFIYIGLKLKVRNEFFTQVSAYGGRGKQSTTDFLTMRTELHSWTADSTAVFNSHIGYFLQ